MRERSKECPICKGTGEVTDVQYAEQYSEWIRENAEAYGITKEQMIEVDEYECEPRCGATTAKGTRCKNSPTSSRTEKDCTISWFLKHHGNYCGIHGG